MKLNYIMIRLFQLLQKNLSNTFKNIILFLFISYFSFISIAFIFSIYQDVSTQISRIPITIVYAKNEEAFHAQNNLYNMKSKAIDSISIVTSEAGMAEFTKRYGNISNELNSDNTFPAIVHIYLNSFNLNKDNLNLITDRINEYKDIDKIVFPKEEVQSILNMRNLFYLIIIILVASFLILNIFIILSRIYKEFKIRKSEFSLMKSMGSGKYSIISPVLLYNFISGFIGILLASVAGFLTTYYLQGYKYYDFMQISNILIITVSSIILLKILINLFVLLFYKVKI